MFYHVSEKKIVSFERDTIYPFWICRNKHDWWPGHMPNAHNFFLYRVLVPNTKRLKIKSFYAWEDYTANYEFCEKAQRCVLNDVGKENATEFDWLELVENNDRSELSEILVLNLKTITGIRLLKTPCVNRVT